MYPFMTGIVVSPNLAATEAGVEILVAGGNAVDAAVAAAFVQGVVDPFMCGIGGFGCLLHYDAGSEQVHGLDFPARAGSLVRPDQWLDRSIGPARDGFGYLVEGNLNEVGYESIAVPGMVAGLGQAHERWGRMPWPELLRPAIEVADEGFEITPLVHDWWSRSDTEGRTHGVDRLLVIDACAELFTVEGRPLAVGERCVLSDLAHTLEVLADRGWTEFYRGHLAEVISRDIRERGGQVILEDLATYRPEEVSPIKGHYRGQTVWSMPPPSGGLMLAEILGILERLPLRELRYSSARHVAFLVEAMKYGRSTTLQYGADPEVQHIPIAAILSSSRLDRRADAIANGEQFELRPVAGCEPSTTNQVTVLDRDGGAVSLTHSLGYASGVVTPGLGFVYNNYLNCFNPVPGHVDSLAPHQRRSSSMAPTFVMKDKQVSIAVGAPGATRITPSLVQVITNVLDWKMSPVEAVSAPRVDCQGGPVHLEGRVPTSVEEDLQSLGYAVERHLGNYDRYFARPQLIYRSGQSIRGASDPRADGGTALFAE